MAVVVADVVVADVVVVVVKGRVHAAAAEPFVERTSPTARASATTSSSRCCCCCCCCSEHEVALAWKSASVTSPEVVA